MRVCVCVCIHTHTQLVPLGLVPVGFKDGTINTYLQYFKQVIRNYCSNSVNTGIHNIII